MKVLKYTALILIIFSHPFQLTSQNYSNMQKRYCMALDLRNDAELIRQYKQVHTKQGIWPEIPKGIKESDVSDMEIYLWSNRMYMILEASPTWDFNAGMAKMGSLERQKEWGDYVWQFQQLLPYSQNGEKWMLMEKVFQLNPTGLQETKTSGYTEPVYRKPTVRVCATLDLKDQPELISEYRKYHSPATHWPEVAEGIRSVGILDMQIYLIGNRMFMIVEAEPGFSWEPKMKELSTKKMQDEWDNLMKKFQQALPGTDSVKWEVMENVFDLDRDF